MIKNSQKFYDDLKDFFKKQGLTQQNIAEQLGVSQSYIAMLMTGTKAFGKSTAQTWSECFGLSSAWLLTGEGSMLIENNQNGNKDNTTTKQKHNNNDEEFFALLRKKDEQIDRLLSIIEKMQS